MSLLAWKSCAQTHEDACRGTAGPEGSCALPFADERKRRTRGNPGTPGDCCGADGFFWNPSGPHSCTTGCATKRQLASTAQDRIRTCNFALRLYIHLKLDRVATFVDISIFWRIQKDDGKIRSDFFRSYPSYASSSATTIIKMRTRTREKQAKVNEN